MNGQIKTVLFDVFGTVVDWRTCVARELAAFGRSCGVDADWAQVADGWRARYQPAMEEVRSGRRAWTILDALHRETLEGVLADHGLPAACQRLPGYLLYTIRFQYTSVRWGLPAASKVVLGPRRSPLR